VPAQRIRLPNAADSKTDSSNRKQRTPCKDSKKERIVVWKVVNLGISDGRNCKNGRSGSKNEAE